MVRICFRSLAAAFLVALWAPQALADVYYVMGQANPRFHLEIAVNGTPVKSVRPTPSKTKLFVYQIDKGVVRSGQNTLSITYRVVSEAEGGSSAGRSFKVNVLRKASIRDRSRGEKLVTIRGPRKPYPEAAPPTTVEDGFTAN